MARDPISLSKVKRAALVVAHPDDESLWFGGLLIRHAAIDWTVVCCTIPRRDPERFGLFDAACRALRAEPLKMPFVESEPGKPLKHLHLLPDLSASDLIVTHSRFGEYGHLHHIQIAEHIRERYPDKVAHGGWMPDGQIGDYVVRLTDAEWERKLEALRCYSHVLPWNGRRMPKWEALLANYGTRFDLRAEPYVGLSD